MTEKKLTTRQKQILKFISKFIENNKFPPTRSELAAHFGFRSPNAAESHLRALESKSVIAIERGAARGIALLPLAALILFGIGYASVTTMSIALLSSGIFTILAILGKAPWEYIVYGVVAELLLIWALRPNIRRLLRGEERLVGWRAKKTRQQETA